MDVSRRGARVAVVVKGYPRLSETFIAQELLALEAQGVELEIWSLRHPTEKARHPMHERVRARITYLPEYLYQEPLRVLRGLRWAARQPRFRELLRVWRRDLARDATPNRVRRLGQAFVMARELPQGVRHLHVHYLHSPASVVRYAAMLRDLSWSFSAHAKDIWTTPDWEKREKMADAQWGVTCTQVGHGHLRALAPAIADRVCLAYHGLDLSRFPAPPESRPMRDGSDPDDPVRIVSVGRAVPKKGLEELLAALADLPGDFAWRWTHIGSGALLPRLKRKAARLGLDQRIEWLGARPQGDVITALRGSDLFVLASRPAGDGDRDGLPNVLMEAASQRLAIVSTSFAAIPEFITDEVHGLLVPPQDREALTAAILRAGSDPALRARLAAAAEDRLRRSFGMEAGVDLVATRLRSHLRGTAPDADRLLRPAESA